MGRFLADGAAMKPIKVMRYRVAAGGSVGPGADDFSSNTLGSYTQYADTPANWSISGGYLNSSTAAQAVLTRNGVSFVDGEASCVVTQANDAGVALRLQDLGTYYVAVVHDASGTNGSTNNVELFKRVGGTFTKLGTTVTISFVRGSPHTLTLGASGSSIYVKFDGATKISVSDTSISTAGKCGPRVNNGMCQFDSFTWP